MTNSVHTLVKFCGSTNEVGIGLVGDIHETDVVVFPVVISPRRWLIHVLEPVTAHHGGVAQHILDVVGIGCPPIPLRLYRNQACVEHAPICRSKVKLTDEYRFVQRPELSVVVVAEFPGVDIKTYHIGKPRTGPYDGFGCVGEAAAQVELVGSVRADGLGDSSVVGRGEDFQKSIEILLCGRGSALWFRDMFPCRELGLPRSIKHGEVLVAALQEG